MHRREGIAVLAHGGGADHGIVVAHHLQFDIVHAVTVGDVEVRPQQARLAHLPDVLQRLVAERLVRAVIVDGQNMRLQATDASKGLGRAADRRVLIDGRGQTEAQQVVIAAEQAAHVLGDAPVVLVRGLAAIGHDLGHGRRPARPEDRMARQLPGERPRQAGVPQALHRLLDRLGRVEGVAEVEHRGDAGIDRQQPARILSQIGVFRRVADVHTHLPVDVVVDDRRNLGNGAGMDALPDMAVAIDHARHQDHARRVHDLGAVDGQGLADSDDLAAFHQHVSPVQLAQLRVQGDDVGVADQGAAGRADALGRTGRRSDGGTGRRPHRRRQQPSRRQPQKALPGDAHGLNPPIAARPRERPGDLFFLD